jgi:hypothetical protein
MNNFRTALLLAVWALLASSASAKTPPPAALSSAVQISPAVGVPVETTPVHHVEAREGPIVVNYHFKRAPGFANLIVDSDGSYLFSGNYKGSPPFAPRPSVTYDFSVMLALKSRLGGMILFQYTGLDNGNVQWSKQGKSTVLKDQFKTFEGKHDWAGSYRVSLTPSGKRSLSAYCAWLVGTFGKEWLNSKGQIMLGWSPTDYAEWKGDNCEST